MSKDTNRLAAETSPYLLQHAHNPVDWYGWNSEALAAARALKKPATGAMSWHMNPLRIRKQPK